MEEKKGKYDRATHEQLQHYIDFCRNRPEMLAGKNNPKTPRQMQELWAELAAGLNSLRGPTRTTAKWKETLGVWKSQLRTRARRIKSSLLVTGGTPCTKSLSDFEELALSTLGAAAVHGIGRNTLGLTLPSPATTRSESAPSSQYGLGRGNSLQLDDIAEQCDETLELANGNVSVVGSAVSPEEFSLSSASVSSHSPAVPSSAETQSPSTSQNSISTALDTRCPKSGKLQEVLWEKIKKKEVEEKLRDEQNRKIIEIVQNLANSVSELTQEIQNLKK